MSHTKEESNGAETAEAVDGQGAESAETPPGDAQAAGPQPEPPLQAEPPVDLAAARIADLERQLAETTSRLRAVSKGFADQQDEMAAFRERLDAQNKAARLRREAEVVRAFFEPVQNLKRSIDAGITDPDAFLAGIRMVLNQFADELNKLGLKAIPGVGSDFDPKLHEAIAVMPVADATQDGKILFVHVDGYHIDGRPVQVAQVVIGKHDPGAAETAEA